MTWAGEMGGFGSIGSMFPSEWNWKTFWHLTISIVVLAFMNLLIPALDGGHVVFLLYEIIVENPAS